MKVSVKISAGSDLWNSSCPHWMAHHLANLLLRDVLVFVLTEWPSEIAVAEQVISKGEDVIEVSGGLLSDPQCRSREQQIYNYIRHSWWWHLRSEIG